MVTGATANHSATFGTPKAFCGGFGSAVSSDENSMRQGQPAAAGFATSNVFGTDNTEEDGGMFGGAVEPADGKMF